MTENITSQALAEMIPWMDDMYRSGLLYDPPRKQNGKRTVQGIYDKYRKMEEALRIIAEDYKMPFKIEDPAEWRAWYAGLVAGKQAAAKEALSFDPLA